MEYRQYGEIPTLDTRAEAHEKVDKKKRYSQIIECFRTASKNNNGCNMGLTAKEIAVMMWRKGYIPTSERNFSAPRLTEMAQAGIVEPIGKKVCEHTGHKVAVYVLREGNISAFETKEA